MDLNTITDLPKDVLEALSDLEKFPYFLYDYITIHNRWKDDYTFSLSDKDIANITQGKIKPASFKRKMNVWNITMVETSTSKNMQEKLYWHNPKKFGPHFKKNGREYLHQISRKKYKRLPRNVSQQQALSDNNNEPIIDHTYANCQKVDNDKTAQSEEGGMAKEMIRKALELIANKDKVNKRVIARVTATVNSLLGLPVDLSKTVDIGIRLFCEGKEVKPVDGNVFNIKTKDPFAKVKVEIKNKNIEEIEVKSWVDDDEPGFATIEAEETLEVEVEAPVNEFFVMSCHDAPPKIDGKYEIVGIQINFEE